jgi:hypothetical protein
MKIITTAAGTEILTRRNCSAMFPLPAESHLVGARLVDDARMLASSRPPRQCPLLINLAGPKTDCWSLLCIVPSGC